MKILAYTSPARGHLYPLVPILDELAGRGHDISLRTLASQVALMTDRGFDAAPIAAAIEAIEHDDYRGRTSTGRLKRGLATFAARATHEIEDLRGAIAAQRPDALLVDTATWGASAAAEGWGERSSERAFPGSTRSGSRPVCGRSRRATRCSRWRRCCST
jgi:UDP:flavonoid glycosyltransferase YjiC (YdhE family)